MNYKILFKSILEVISAFIGAGIFLIVCYLVFSSIPEEAWGYIVTIGIVSFVIGGSVYNVYQSKMRKLKGIPNRNNF